MRQCAFILLLFVFSSLFSLDENPLLVNENSISLIPQEFFVGDEVRLLYAFTSNESALSALTEEGPFSFSEPDLFTAGGFDCVCKSLQITRNTNSSQKNAYILTITFYPYTVGLIDLPSFDLGKLIPNGEQKGHEGTGQGQAPLLSMFVDFPSFTVMPILSRYPSDTIRPAQGPVIIPGTTYVLYGIAALLVITIGSIIYIFLKFEKMAKKARSWVRFLCMSVNLRQSLREIKRLQKKGDDVSSSVFAQKIETILRSFLEKRFFLPFSCACTDEIKKLFDERFKETYNAEQHDAVQHLYELFLRCDFIRFSFVEQNTQTLGADERQQLLQRARNLLLFFEKGVVNA